MKTMLEFETRAIKRNKFTTIVDRFSSCSKRERHQQKGDRRLGLQDLPCFYRVAFWATAELGLKSLEAMRRPAKVRLGKSLLRWSDTGGGFDHWKLLRLTYRQFLMYSLPASQDARSRERQKAPKPKSQPPWCRTSKTLTCKAPWHLEWRTLSTGAGNQSHRLPSELSSLKSATPNCDSGAMPGDFKLSRGWWGLRRHRRGGRVGNFGQQCGKVWKGMSIISTLVDTNTESMKEMGDAVWVFQAHARVDLRPHLCALRRARGSLGGRCHERAGAIRNSVCGGSRYDYRSGRPRDLLAQRFQTRGRRCRQGLRLRLQHGEVG